jgi:hypothetical protein
MNSDDDSSESQSLTGSFRLEIMTPHASTVPAGSSSAADLDDFDGKISQFMELDGDACKTRGGHGPS